MNISDRYKMESYNNYDYGNGGLFFSNMSTGLGLGGLGKNKFLAEIHLVKIYLHTNVHSR